MDVKENEKVQLKDTEVKFNKTKPDLGDTRHVVKKETKHLAKDLDQPKIETRKAHKFRIVEEIGHGTFGLVLLVQNIDTAEQSALKVMELEEFDPTELKILRLLKKLNGHGNHCIELINTFRTKGIIYLQFPLYGPTLQSIMEQESFTRFSEAEICEIMKQICLGVKFLHDHHIVHSDLKQDNVIFVYGTTARDFNRNHSMDDFIDSQLSQHMFGIKGPKIFLIDFGQAFLDPEGTGVDKTVCCVVYRPPESHLEMNVSKPVDVWSVGILCFLMYQRRQLLQCGSPLEMLAQMEQIFGQFPKKLRMVEAAEQYFTSGFTKRPPDFDQSLLQNAKSFQKYRGPSVSYSYRLFPLMENILKLDPEERITMKEIIKSENW